MRLSQRHTDNEALWEVFASPADLNGDHVAVSGAAARFRPIVLGNSFHDRGMRNDSHDAVAVVITLREAKKRKTASDSQESRGALQPASEKSVPQSRSPSLPAADFSVSMSEAESEANYEAEHDLRQRADEVHREMR